ncbi:MAG TPA: hypothetical protein VNL17_03885 [Verrucomicrobiae bacterium]|nr:hypothetical protein [Verrucomicrobiae bacterium]
MKVSPVSIILTGVGLAGAVVQFLYRESGKSDSILSIGGAIFGATIFYRCFWGRESLRRIRGLEAVSDFEMRIIGMAALTWALVSCYVFARYKI